MSIALVPMHHSVWLAFLICFHASRYPISVYLIDSQMLFVNYFFGMIEIRYNKLAEMKNDKMSFSNGESIGDNLPEDSVWQTSTLISFVLLAFWVCSHRMDFVVAVSGAAYIHWLPKDCFGNTECNPNLCTPSKSWGITILFMFYLCSVLLYICNSTSPDSIILVAFHTWQVVYAILHRQEVFHPFKSHPRFNELLDNLFTVCLGLSYLYNRKCIILLKTSYTLATK